MRGIMQIAAFLVLGAMLDLWLYNGLFTDGFLRMLVHIKSGFGFG
jgi:hypothetical protein